MQKKLSSGPSQSRLREVSRAHNPEERQKKLTLWNFIFASKSQGFSSGAVKPDVTPGYIPKLASYLVQILIKADLGNEWGF
jgi:hypothetical protein